jgi:hypothetical protein
MPFCPETRWGKDKAKTADKDKDRMMLEKTREGGLKGWGAENRGEESKEHTQHLCYIAGTQKDAGVVVQQELRAKRQADTLVRVRVRVRVKVR